MKIFRLIQTGFVALLFSSCILEVSRDSQDSETLSGMWAYVNNQSQTVSFLEFKDGKMTSYSASGNRTVADGYIWHSSESDFAAAMTWNYRLDVDNLLYLDGKQSGKLVIEGDTMTYGNDKLVSVTGFSPEWYSKITTGIAGNIIKASLLEQELEYELSIVNPIPNSSVDITVSPAGSAGASITTDGKLLIKLEETNESSTSTILFQYPGAEDLKIILVREANSTFAVSRTEWAYDYRSQSVSIPFFLFNPAADAEVKAELTSDVYWIKGLSIGKDDSTVNFTLDENNDSSRSVGINLSAKGAQNLVLNIAQLYSKPQITLSKLLLSLSYEARYSQSFSYAVSNPRDGGTSTVSCSESWVTNLNDNNGAVTFDVAENNSGSYRTASIVVTYEHGSHSAAETITINQDSKYLVDLGLSVKWASCNLGASSPAEYGGHYQWAGTTDVSDTGIRLEWSNCPYHTGSDEHSGWTKYNMDPSFGTADNKTVLEAMDDAASVALGGKWRMPTDVEWKELRNNCSWTWTTVDGVNGYKVQSKKSGYTDKWIFLPAAGYRLYNVHPGLGSYGLYWSSTLSTDLRYVFSMGFDSSLIRSSNYVRFEGQSIRPVSE